LFAIFKDKDFFNKFLKVSFPVMIHSFLLFIVSFVDNLMISSVSNEAVSAVYAANQATYILMIAAFGVLIGAGVFIQQFNGAKDEKNLKQAFNYKIVVMIIFLVIFVTIYYLFGHYLVKLYCDSDSNSAVIYELGTEYLYVVVLSYIPYCLSMIYSTTVREIGETKYALYSGAIALVVNIIFNSIFIYVFDMGVIGAALGTIIARIMEFASIVIMCHVRKFSFCNNLFKEFKIDKNLFILITKKGIVFLANELFWVIGMTLLSLAYARREDVLSALSVVGSVGNIFNIIFQGLSIGIGVIVGSYLGEGDYENAKSYTKKMYSLGFFVSLAFGLLITILSPVIPVLFKEISIEQKSLASQMLFAYGLLLWSNCLYCCCYMTLKTGGLAKTTFVIDSGLMWFCVVPITWCLVLFTDISLLYIYIFVTAFDLIKFIISYTFVKKEKWLNNLTTNI